MTKKGGIATLAVFDFDGTITTRDTFNDFYIYAFGLGRYLTALARTLPQTLLYILGYTDNFVPKQKIFTALSNGMQYDDLANAAQRYAHNRLPLRIRQEALDRIKWHQSQGHAVAIVSASLSEWITPWAALHGISIIETTRILTRKNSLVAGLSHNCFGLRKREVVQKLMSSRGYKTLYAYGDSSHDLPFLQIADYAYLHSFDCMANTRYAIVTDALWRKSLSAIRSLGKAGYAVSAYGNSYFTTGLWSRFTKRQHIAPTASDSAEDFGKSLIADLQSYTGSQPVLLPMEDASLIWCTRNQKKLASYCETLFPPLSSLTVAEDKAATMRVARAAGIPTPRTYYPKNSSDLSRIISRLPKGSFIVKPVHASGSSGLIYLDIKKKYDWDYHWKVYGASIIQERIDVDGEALGVSLLYDKNRRCVAAFAHKRLQQYPNSGGPSTDRVSIHNRELIKLSMHLMEHLRWKGVAMVEWKLDTRTHKPRLMEINPRFWGSLELAVRSGIDFPTLYARAAHGEILPLAQDYAPGIRCRWMIPGDILRFITQAKNKRESLRQFLSGSLHLAEEWDARDVSGFISTIICTCALALNPRYWKYVRRG